MRQILFVFIPLVLTSCSEPQSENAALKAAMEGTEWVMVWQDEFDGTELDLEKWDIQQGDGCELGICGWGNNELQWYQSENISVEEGKLVITAREETKNDYAYTSARLRTKGKRDWTYGKIEVNARLPEGQGMWPAVWMLPTDDAYGRWAASGEIDIMELLGNEPNKILGSLHFGGSWPDNVHLSEEYIIPDGSFAESFHTYSIQWEEGEIRWYVDDIEYAKQTKWRTNGHKFPAPFDKDFHLLLNVAVGGSFPGNPDETTRFPQKMEVDFVRVYQRGNESN